MTVISLSCVLAAAMEVAVLVIARIGRRRR